MTAASAVPEAHTYIFVIAFMADDWMNTFYAQTVIARELRSIFKWLTSAYLFNCNLYFTLPCSLSL